MKYQVRTVDSGTGDHDVTATPHRARPGLHPKPIWFAQFPCMMCLRSGCDLLQMKM